MAQVIVRNLEERIVERLKARAQRHGRSLEAELRALLSESVAGEPNEFIAWVRKNRLPAISGFDTVSVIREQRQARSNTILHAVRRRR